MFERDALDNTVSVARGPRESMKPRITEIAPASVEAGKATTVILRGANLVGAQVTARTPGVVVKPEPARATSIGVVVHIAAAGKLGLGIADPKQIEHRRIGLGAA